MTALPRTLPDYLQALREALAGADPALVQDALFDAEEYLRAELAARPGADEATVLAEVASSYGAPDEVAAIYTDREQQVELALRPYLPPAQAAPTPRAAQASHASPAAHTAQRTRAPLQAQELPWYRRFFGVALDPHTYGALFYALLALPLGIFYFTWVVTGVALSAGLAILIIGVPFMIAFMGTVYVLSLVEGRMVESLLGVRMPRRRTPPPAAAPLLTRVGQLLGDPRTWSTLLYMLLMLPLGIGYFTVTVALLSLSIGLFGGAFAQLLYGVGVVSIDGFHYGLPPWTAPLVALLGIALFFASLHLLRAIGRLHGALAKTMLVQRA
jgi:hypothetical protein